MSTRFLLCALVLLAQAAAAEPTEGQATQIVSRATPHRYLDAVPGANHQYVIYAGGPPLSHPIRVGDMLYVYVHQKRISLRHLDRYHFSLIQQGVIPECPPTASCAFPPGVYYRVVAIRPGRAVLPIGGHQVARVQIAPRA